MQLIINCQNFSWMIRDLVFSVIKFVLRIVLPYCSLIVLLMLSNLAHAMDLSEQEVRERVYELINCLGGSISAQSEQEFTVYQNILSKNLMDKPITECMKRRVIEYPARDFASYAMGVSLQRKLLRYHEAFNSVDFINGFLRAESGSVEASELMIQRANKETLLDDSEASQLYLERFVERRDVKEASGVFFTEFKWADGSNFSAGKLSPKEFGRASEESMFASEWADAFTREELCDEVGATSDNQLKIKFHRVMPINKIFIGDDIHRTEIGCIDFQVDNVIRGWRLVMENLESGVIYDVLIPSELAYGARGVPGVVEGGENLRFLMHVSRQ